MFKMFKKKEDEKWTRLYISTVYNNKIKKPENILVEFPCDLYKLAESFGVENLDELVITGVERSLFYISGDENIEDINPRAEVIESLNCNDEKILIKMVEECFCKDTESQEDYIEYILWDTDTFFNHVLYEYTTPDDKKIIVEPYHHDGKVIGYRLEYATYIDIDDDVLHYCKILPYFENTYNEYIQYLRDNSLIISDFYVDLFAENGLFTKK